MLDVNKIRDDFPILRTSVYGRELVYLDNAATAQKPQRVIDCVNRLHRELNGNIHRGVHYMSEECTSLYEAARQTMCDKIGAADAREIVFTSGATASVNLVAYSFGEMSVGEGDNVIVSEMEHHSNIVPWQLLCERKGAELRVLPFDDDGRLAIEKLPSLIDSRTRIVAVTQCSNVLGTCPDIKAVTETAHSFGVPVLVDGCQGAVHMPTDVQALGCDFYAFSGHKLYGPTGTGVLYGRAELLEKMPPFMGGGDMVDRVSFSGTTFAAPPLKFEAGTSNYIGAIGMAEAVHYLDSIDLAAASEHENTLREYAERLLSQIDGLRIYGSQTDKGPIVSFGVEGVHNYDMGMILDKLGIAVRTGMHCAEPVMQHYGVGGMCRASFAIYNTREEVEALADGVKRAVKMLR